MKTFKTISGYGYITDKDGNIVAKCNLPPGDHPIKDGYTYYEVASREDLDAVLVYAAPKSAARVRREKIDAEIEKMAVERLIAKGEISE